MAYSAESHTGYVTYELELAHTSGIRMRVTADPFLADGSTPTEALRDSMFQLFLTALAGIAGTSIVSATKRGQFTASVTP